MPKSPALRASRREILLAGAAAGASFLLPGVARADAPFYYPCDRQSAISLDPNAHKRVGYLTDFSVVHLPAPLLRDMGVFVPWSGPAAPTYTNVLTGAPPAAGGRIRANVVGILESVTWGGGVSDPIQINAWVSQQNATQLKTIQQSTLSTTNVSTLGYWIVDYDQQAKVWYEQHYPLNPFTTGGQLSTGGAGLTIDLTAVQATPGINTYIYKVVMSIVPTPSRMTMLQCATSSTVNAPKQWGLLPVPAPTPPRKL